MTEMNDATTDANALEHAWGAWVRANRDQAERVREQVEADFYGTTSRRFVVDPRRDDDPTLDALVALAQPDETWLDIGAGAGRFALPLALRVREVIAVDPSPAMLGGLRAGMAEHGIANLRVIEGRWPSDHLAGPPPVADVSLIAHVGYDIEGIGEFLEAMEAATRRLCVAVMATAAPSTPAAAFWPAVHGEDRHLLPALPDFVALLRARGTPPAVQMTEHGLRRFGDRDEALQWLRHQCFIAAGGAADGRLRAALDGFAEDAQGQVAIPGVTADIGVVTWEPRRR